MSGSTHTSRCVHRHGLLFALALALSGLESEGAEYRQTVTLTLPAATCQASSNEVFYTAPDAQIAGLPGDPMLASRQYRIVLRPNVLPQSVQVVAQTKASQTMGSARVAPVAPYRTLQGDPLPRADGVALVDSRNALVYGQDATYPATQILSKRVTDYLGFKILTVRVPLVRYNDMRRQVEQIQRLQLNITYQTAPPAEPSPTPLAVARAFTRIREWVLQNGVQTLDDIRAWYAVDLTRLDPRPLPCDYLIITTREIYEDRDINGIREFVAHKRFLGHYPEIEVVGDICARYPEQTRVQAIKSTIRDYARKYGIQYVLLLGHPDCFADGDHAEDPERPVPMNLCEVDLPWTWEVANWFGFDDDARCMTDAYYSDLDGDWDGDADGQCAESWGDVGEPDVEVGRLFVYQGYLFRGVQHMRTLLNRIIAYDLEIDKTWRFNALLSGSYNFGTINRSSSEVVDRVYQRIHAVDARYAAHRIFQDGRAFGLADSWFDGIAPDADDPLISFDADGNSSFSEEWSNGQYGLVFWNSHGSLNAATIGYPDHSTYAGEFLYKWGDYSKYPSVVFAEACDHMETGTMYYLSGEYEYQYYGAANLAMHCLQTQAVCFAGFTGASISRRANDPTPETGDGAWYMQEFLEAVAAGRTFGQAFWDAKRTVAAEFSANHHFELLNYLRLNILADPSQRLFETLDRVEDDGLEAAPGNDTAATARELYNAKAVYGLTTHDEWTAVEIEHRQQVAKDEDWVAFNDMGGSSDKFFLVTLTPGTDYFTTNLVGVSDNDPYGMGTWAAMDVDFYNGSGTRLPERMFVNTNSGSQSLSFLCESPAATSVKIKVEPGRHACAYHATFRTFFRYQPHVAIGSPHAWPDPSWFTLKDFVVPEWLDRDDSLRMLPLEWSRLEAMDDVRIPRPD